jgi:hypothetical protein
MKSTDARCIEARLYEGARAGRSENAAMTTATTMATTFCGCRGIKERKGGIDRGGGLC